MYADTPARRWYLALMALLALAASVTGKICDRIVVHGRESCGPALLLPDFEECGAHLVEEFTKLHPHVRWATKAVSVPFDPVQVVRDLNPGVTPDDGYVWAARLRIAGNSDPLILGADLMSAFPSAKVILSICDPSQLPYRLFVDGILTSLDLADSRAKASPRQLQSFVQEHGGLASLRELFWAAYPPNESTCHHRKRDLDTLKALREAFTVKNGLFEPELCERWQLHNYVDDVWPAIRGSRENSLALLRVPDAHVRRWIEAGYELITDHHPGRLAVVVMENWPEHGRRYIELVQRLLLLTDVYPWSKADFSLAALPSRAWLAPQGLDAPLTLAGDVGLVVSSCDHLTLMLGETLAWPGCDQISPSPPSSPPLHPCVWDRQRLEPPVTCSTLRFSKLCEGQFEAGRSMTAPPRPCAWNSGRCAAIECHTLPPAPPPSVLVCYAMRYDDLLDGYCAGRIEDCDWDALRVHYETAGEEEHRKRGNCEHPPFPPPVPPKPPSPCSPPAPPPVPAPSLPSRSPVASLVIFGLPLLQQLGLTVTDGEVRVIMLGVVVPLSLTLLLLATWLLRLRSEHGRMPSPRELQPPPVPKLPGRRTVPWRTGRYASLPAAEEEGLPPAGSRVANATGYPTNVADVEVL